MNPPSKHDLRAVAFSEAETLPRAGSPAEQAAFQDQAWSMLATYTTPARTIGARLSNEWLGSRDWRVQLIPLSDLRHPAYPDILEHLQIWLAAHGVQNVLGTSLDPDVPRPTAVFRIPADEPNLRVFFYAHYTGFHALFAEDLSFAVVANEGDFAAVAGPEGFVRNALPPEFVGPEATAHLKAELENEIEPGWFDGILTHYAPFMLDD
jgi:hypothetical protein